LPNCLVFYIGLILATAGDLAGLARFIQIVVCLLSHL